MYQHKKVPDLLYVGVFVIILTILLMSACSPTAPTAVESNTSEPAATQPSSNASTSAPATAEPSGKVTVQIWGGPPDIESLKAAFANFNKVYPNITIEVQVPNEACGVSFAACKTLHATGSMPDVFVPGIWTYNALVDTGLLENLTPLMQRDGVSLADYVPVVAESMQALKDGQVYGLPMGMNIQNFYYNKDMFDKAGIPYPPANGDFTWEDVRAWAKKMTIDDNGNTAESPDFDRKKIKQWGFTPFIGFSPGTPQTTEAILRAYGGSIMTLPDRAKCNLEDEATLKGLQFIYDWMYKDHTMVTPADEQEQLGFLRWVAGQVAMQFLDHSQVPLVKANNPTLNYGITAAPKGPAGNATLIQTHIWSMYSGSKNKEAAWLLIKWLGTEGQLMLHDGSTQMGLIPTYKKAYEGPVFLQNPGEPENLKAAQIDPLQWELVTFPSQYNTKADQIASADGFGAAIDAIRLGEKSPEEAVAGVCEKVNAIMEAGK